MSDAASTNPAGRRYAAGAGMFFARGLDWKAMVVIVLLVAAAIIVPASVGSPDSPFHLSDNTTILAGKYLCYALLALSVGLVWGYGGILSLGHGAFFALGGYAMGMYLMRQIGTRGVYGNPVLPDFMVFLQYTELPWFWNGFDQFWFAAIWIFLGPGLLAFAFGWFAFRSRVTGVYLSIITQAMTYALWLAFFRNDMGFGGNNGLTDFKDILGANVQASSTRAWVFAASAIALALGYWICRSVVASKYGKVLIAIRDAESRTRFLGYRPDRYKLFVFTLSACMAGVAGALYVPQAGIINPSEFSPLKSIEIVIWVAVGGRGTLIGPILGGILVNAMKSYFTGGATVVHWVVAIFPAAALLAILLMRRKERFYRSPAFGLLIGTAAAAVAFALPDSVAPWWCAGLALGSIILWLITTGAHAAAAVFPPLIVLLLRDPDAVVALAPYWTFVLGGLFVLVTLLLPKGIVGTVSYGWNAWRARRESVEAQEGRDADLTDPEPIRLDGAKPVPPVAGQVAPAAPEASR